MNKLINCTTLILSVGVTTLSYQAKSAPIRDNQITPSTSLVARAFSNLGPFSVDQVADGVISDDEPLAGFVATSGSGTINLRFDYEYDVDSFLLWNDVRIGGQGIKDFSLDFFDISGSLIASHSSSVINGQFVGPTFEFNSEEYIFDNTILSVYSVDLVVANSHASDIELREVEFTGTLSNVPEPSTLYLICLGFVSVGLSSTYRNKQLKSTS